MPIDHAARALPDARLPHGLVRIVVWKRVGHNHWAGTGYRASSGVWRNERDYTDFLDDSKAYDWAFDGFNLDYFNRGYLLAPAQQTPPLVRLAMWALERWAKDVGLIATSTGQES